MNQLHSVLSVTAKMGFILEIAFEDGKTFALDFKRWINSETGRLFNPLKDLAYFARVFVHGGALEWPNGLDICGDGMRAWCEQGSIPLQLHPNVSFHYTPTHASWVNLIECFFSILTRQGLQQSVHKSGKDLERFLKAYFAEYNQHCEPFQWTKGPDKLPRINELTARFQAAHNASN